MLTEFGKSLFDEPVLITNKIYERIILDEIIGKIFAHLLLFNADLKEYSYTIIKEYYPDYSDAVIERRASTLINWCKEIYNYIN